MRVTFEEREKITNDIFSFYFSAPETFSYLAGQYAQLMLPTENRFSIGGNRWFTLSSSPTEDQLAITTKFIKPYSLFKQVLLDLKKGQTLVMSEPIGDFVLPKDSSTPLVFISGGIGITPVRSIIKSLIDTKDKRPISLIYFAKSKSELIFDDLLKKYPMDYSPIITVRPEVVWQNLPKLEKPDPNALFFVSGPQLMVETIADNLASKIGKSHVVMDYFPGYISI